jgi:small subunit ribosomal protein S16
MPVKMRLARHGRKRYAYYHIVVADSRAPRDGRYIERIGSYNPNTDPATIDLDFDKAYDWLVKGAQPTDTVRAILSYKGVLYRNHLAKGVTKGALTEEQAEAKYQGWLKEKEAKIEGNISDIESAEKAEAKARHEAEAKVNNERAAVIAKRKAEAMEAEAPAAEEAPEASEEAVAEAATEEAPVTEKETKEEEKKDAE